jgi:large subunit ribosomal protein L21
MHAIVEVGAKQFNVKKDDIIEVNKQEAEKGKVIVLDKVLLVYSDKAIEVGQPYVKGAKVEATVLGQTKGEKTVSYKYRRRKGSSDWKKGHRAKLTELKIKGIELGL